MLINIQYLFVRVHSILYNKFSHSIYHYYFYSFCFLLFCVYYLPRVSHVLCCTSFYSRDSYTKTQEVHGSQSFACRIQLQLITFAMTFVDASAAAGSFRVRAINFHSAILSSMGGHFRQRAAFLREIGIDLKNAAAKLQLATRPLPVCPRAPSGHPSGVPFRWINPSRLSFAIPDLLNVRFFTVHEISLQRHVQCVVASLPFVLLCFLRSKNFDCPMRSNS